MVKLQTCDLALNVPRTQGGRQQPRWQGAKTFPTTVLPVTGLRVFIALAIVAIVAISAIPLLVVFDLVGGGDGWGLCPDGLSSCRTSYFDGPELAAVLTLLVFGLLLLVRIAQRAQRRLQRTRSDKVAGPVHPPRSAGRREA